MTKDSRIEKEDLLKTRTNNDLDNDAQDMKTIFNYMFYQVIEAIIINNLVNLPKESSYLMILSLKYHSAIS